MFDKLAMFIILASETPAEPARAWQTKTACMQEGALDESFLQGFYDRALNKMASDNEVYILGSEMGKELSVNILYNMKQSMK